MISLKALTGGLTAEGRAICGEKPASRETRVGWICDKYICGEWARSVKTQSFSSLNRVSCSGDSSGYIIPGTLIKKLPELATNDDLRMISCTYKPDPWSNLKQGLEPLQQQPDCHRAKSGGKAGALLENVARCFIYRCRAADRISGRFLFCFLPPWRFQVFYPLIKLSITIDHHVCLCSYYVKTRLCGADKLGSE